MNEHGKESLAERVERLEKATEEVRNGLRGVNRRLDRALFGPGQGGSHTKPAPAPVRDRPPDGEPAALRHTADKRRDEPREELRDGFGADRGFRLPVDLGDLKSGEWWLNKVGIGLLLFGVAFLYLLSVERGWVGPPVRVGFGLAVGAALLVLGLRIYRDRRAFARVLLGGGVGAFYITGFAAYALYALVPHPVAFGFMVAVTLLALFLSLRQDEATLSLVGALGGLGTPFVLHEDTQDPGGLVLYTCLILAGTGAIHFYNGWASLFGISFVGGWAVLLAGFAAGVSSGAGPYPGDQRALQLGVVFAWLLFWLAPAIREALRSRDPALPLPAPGPLARALGGDGSIVSGGAPAHLASVAAPLVALAFTQGIWSFRGETLGWIAFGGAAFYALAAFVLRRMEGGRGPEAGSSGIAHTQALVGLLLSTLALVLVLDGDALFFALAAEAAVLHLVARRLSDRMISAGAHALFLAAASWLGVRLATGIVFGHPTFPDVPALLDLAVIALAFGVSSKVSPRPAVRMYRILAHLAALAWLARGLLPLPDGDTWTLLSWALYAAGLCLLSRRLPDWGTPAGTHALCAVVALWLGARLIGGAAPGSPVTIPVFNLWGMADLAIIALLALAALVVPPLPPRGSVFAYRLAAHAAFLALLWRELSALPGGDAYVTVAWGFYAVGLFVAGLHRDHAALVRGGLATLFLVVGKLFIVDLAQVDTGWRVLLFLGFGGLFLVLSYYLRSLWKPGAGEGRYRREDRPGAVG